MEVVQEAPKVSGVRQPGALRCVPSVTGLDETQKNHAATDLVSAPTARE
jgi:hypothetical protein